MVVRKRGRPEPPRRGSPCDQCEAEGQRRSEFVVAHADGTRRALQVCALCYLQLKRWAERPPSVPRAGAIFVRRGAGAPGEV